MFSNTLGGIVELVFAGILIYVLFKYWVRWGSELDNVRFGSLPPGKCSLYRDDFFSTRVHSWQL